MNMELNKLDFWARLNECIKIRGFTQESLSIQCGFSKRRIENLSVSKRLPDVFEAYLIAKELGTTVEFLVTGINNKSDSEQFEKFQSDLSTLLNLYKK